MTESVTYELPLNERIRTVLRIDFLANQFAYFVNGTEVWESRAALETLLDTIILVERPDLKSELIKELERHITRLTPFLEKKTSWDEKERLRILFLDYNQTLELLQTRIGPLATQLRTDEFLLDVQNRIGLPGGSCDFDAPRYHQWLKRGLDERQQHLRRWAEELKPIWQTTKLILRSLRSFGFSENSVAENGLFQMNFPQESACQLVRVAIPAANNYYPEISGDRHRITIRFFTAQLETRPVQVTEDVSFILVSCFL